MPIFNNIFKLFAVIAWAIYQTLTWPVDWVLNSRFLRVIWLRFIVGKCLNSRLGKKIGIANAFPGENVVQWLHNKTPGLVAALKKDSLKKKYDPTWEINIIENKRLAYAEHFWPKTETPTLYKQVPPDVARSIVSDGRIIGTDISVVNSLAGAALTPDVVSASYKDAVRDGARAAFFIFGVLVFAIWIIVANSTSEQNKISANAAYGMQSEAMSSQLSQADVVEKYQDIFTMPQYDSVVKAVNEKSDAAAKRGAAVAKAVAVITVLISGLISGALLAVGALIVAVGCGMLVWLGSWRGRVFTILDEHLNDFRRGEREALQRWRWRHEGRRLDYQAYCSQVETVTDIDRSPTILLGESLGVTEFRGHLLGARPATPIRMSIMDLMQHVEVYGNTGEGKSRNVYKPIVRQLLKLRAEGYPIAIYATDNKGDVGKDVTALAKEAGIPDSEIITIGTGPDDYRVDLLEGLDPIEFTTVMQAVAIQAGGGSGDTFWPAMASDIILQIMIVLRAAELSMGGVMWGVQNGRRLYSILSILETLTNDALLDEAIGFVTDAVENITPPDFDAQKYGVIYEHGEVDSDGVQLIDTPYSRVHAVANDGTLNRALSYINSRWKTMVDATKDGIRANARNSLRAFATVPEISRGFADGEHEKLLPASELLGNRITIINISNIEFGEGARFVNILLKSLLYKQARLAQKKDPLSAVRRDNYWRNAKPGKEHSEHFLTVFLADEFQSLVTADKSGSGMSDAEAWNVLRSTGIAGILISQSIAAYAFAVGEDATRNMRNNWLTTICLRTSDVPTIDCLKDLAGKAMRFKVGRPNLIESTVAARYEYGADPDNMTPAIYSKEAWTLKPSGRIAWRFNNFITGNEEDESRYHSANAQAGQAANSSGAKSPMDIEWRYADKHEASLTDHNVSEEDTVRKEDFILMGRGRAFVYCQRGGGTRVEFVKLES